LFFILRDETSKTTTYGGDDFCTPGCLTMDSINRQLILDFNRLENPPCAYTVYATCPLPPEQNQLGVSLEAGNNVTKNSACGRPKNGAQQAKYNSLLEAYESFLGSNWRFVLRRP